MSMPPPTSMRAGDYVMNFPIERPGDRDTARTVMRRNGCRSIRFDVLGEPPATGIVAHGYVGRMSGPGVEEL
jgi:hypothetical protein